MPNEYNVDPKKFTKALKPPLSKIRRQDITVAGYFGDLITLVYIERVCIQNISKIIYLLDSLGFVIHAEKSIFLPYQTIEYLCFFIHSVFRTLFMTFPKKQGIVEF